MESQEIKFVAMGADDGTCYGTKIFHMKHSNK